MSLTVYREELSWTNNLRFVIQSYAYGSIADAKGIELQTQPGNRVIVPIHLTGRDEFLRDSTQKLKLRTGCGYFIPMNHPARLHPRLHPPDREYAEGRHRPSPS